MGCKEWDIEGNESLSWGIGENEWQIGGKEWGMGGRSEGWREGVVDGGKKFMIGGIGGKEWGIGGKE